MIIYKITNMINNKVYIGQTTRSLRVRWQEHCKSSNCKRLHRAIIKYNKSNFIIEKIDEANSIDELNRKEIYWVQYFKSNNRKYGYNIELGGDNKTVCSLTKQKLKKRKHPSSSCEDWSKKLTGIKKWSNENYKKPKSEKHKYNISKNQHKRTPVSQYTLDGIYIADFETIQEASDFTGIKRNSISACCTGRTKSAHGFIWKYKALTT